MKYQDPSHCSFRIAAFLFLRDLVQFCMGEGWGGGGLIKCSNWVYWIYISRMGSTEITRVLFVRDFLFASLKYLLAAENPGSDFSGVWLDVSF